MRNGINGHVRQDSLVIAASGDEVRRASEWLTALCRQHAVPEAHIDRLELALNEVLANVLAHGGGAALVETIRIRLDVRPDAAAGEARVTVSDAGVAFNPVTVPEHVQPRTLAEAEPGGLGLPLIRRCADWMEYCREGGHNHFTFGARWTRA